MSKNKFNKLTIDQLVNVILAKILTLMKCTVPQWAQKCEPDMDRQLDKRMHFKIFRKH